MNQCLKRTSFKRTLKMDLTDEEFELLQALDTGYLYHYEAKKAVLQSLCKQGLAKPQFSTRNGKMYFKITKRGRQFLHEAGQNR